MPSIERHSLSSPPQNLSEEERAKKEFPDFFQFCRENTSYLRFFEHKPTYKNGEPQILLEGVLTPWKEAKSKIFGDKPPASLKIPHGWKYNANGVVYKNMIHWNKLEPDWKDPTPMPGHFFIELVSVTKGTRHCWIRLIDDQSNVISLGFCGYIYKWLPFRASKGKLVSPDPNEFDKAPHVCTRIEISSEQYQSIINKAETDQKNKNVFFNLITRNCSIYACDILKEIGINIRNREYPSQILTRWALSALNIKIPPCVAVGLNYVAAFFRLLLSPIYLIGVFVLGGTYSNSDIQNIEKENSSKWPTQPRKLFNGWVSLLNNSNFSFGTGWKVREWQKTISEWREKQYQKELSQIERERRTCLHYITAEQEEDFKNRLFKAKYGFPPKVEATPLGFQISPLELVKEWSP
jgi:hypothetical protein